MNRNKKLLKVICLDSSKEAIAVVCDDNEEEQEEQ